MTVQALPPVATALSGVAFICYTLTASTRINDDRPCVEQGGYLATVALVSTPAPLLSPMTSGLWCS